MRSFRAVVRYIPLRQLTAKAFLATVSEGTTGYLRPTQLGLGTENGCEAVVHALQKHDGIDGFSFLREIRRVALGFARYCDLCYSSDSFFPERSPRKSGVQHIDPSGPLLFALGVEGATSEGRTQAETTRSPLDLTTVGGSHQSAS